LLKVYLDSSAIVKRYISEPGTPVADKIFDKCWEGELLIATSIWNIGEDVAIINTPNINRTVNGVQRVGAPSYGSHKGHTGMVESHKLIREPTRH